MKQYLLCAIIGILCLGSVARADEESVSSQYPIISAYIYNFTQFTTWPSDAVKDTFTVCVLGRDPFGTYLAPLKSRTVNNKNIIIRHYDRYVGAVSACNVLFVADSERADVETIVTALKGAPVLTMSDIDGFVDRGGMVEFGKKDLKIGIKIGLKSVQNAGIAISSKLLRIADTDE